MYKDEFSHSFQEESVSPSVQIIDAPQGNNKPTYIYDFARLAPEYLNRLDGVIWDLDGTLIINNEGSALDMIGRIINDHLEHEHGLRYEHNFRRLAGKPLFKIREIVGDDLSVSIPESVERKILEERKKTPFDDEEVKVHPFFQGLLDAFDRAGIPQVIATGGELDRACRYIDRANLRSYFDKDDGHGWIYHSKKPDTTCYHQCVRTITARRGGIANKKRIIAFEDSVSGALTGLMAGIPTIGHLLAEHIDFSEHHDRYLELMSVGAASVIKRETRAIDVMHAVLTNVVSERRLNRNIGANRIASPTPPEGNRVCIGRQPIPRI